MLSKEIKAAVAEVARKSYWRRRDAEVLLAAFAQKGGTLMGFAKECGVNAERLYRWQRKLGRQKKQLPTPAESPFHPLLVVDEGSGDAGVEVVVGGLRVAVHRGFDEQTLLRVVRLLDSGTC